MGIHTVEAQNVCLTFLIGEEMVSLEDITINSRNKPERITQPFSLLGGSISIKLNKK